MSDADATSILRAASAGDGEAVARLVPVVYEELRRLAAAFLQRERPDHTLDPTALVHEAYLRLVDQSAVDWQGKAHFDYEESAWLVSFEDEGDNALASAIVDLNQKQAQSTRQRTQGYNRHAVKSYEITG